MAEIWAAAIGATAALGSTAYMLSGAGQPQEPNLASSSAELSNAEAQELPIERQLAAAAATGGTVLNPGYTASTSGDRMRAQLQGQIQALQQQINAGGTTSSYNRSLSQPYTNQQLTGLQSQLANLQNQLAAIPAGSGGTVYLNSGGQAVPSSQAMTNFNGYGTAQVQAAIANQMAAGELAQAQQYGPQFISQALQEENEANPQGAAARQAENNLVQQLISQPYDQPVADALTNQVDQQVQAGRGLDAFNQGTLNNAVQSALSTRGAATGGNYPPGDFSASLTTGQAANQRQLASIQKGLSLLGSGTTPQDVEYRRQQQNLSNLASEISGQTPVTEFQSLSGAQSGPAPTVAGQALPTMPDTLNLAGSAAATQYGQQVAQANPWMSGLSTVLNAGNTVANTINAGTRAGTFGPTAG